MAHEVENMFSVKETPWHGLGKVIKDAPQFDQILELAGLKWTVSMRPMFVTGPNGEMVQVEQKAIMRDSDNTVLGYAGDRYKPYQNHEALAFYKNFYNSGALSFETAGSLRSGQKVWFLAKINADPIDLGHNDIVNKYLLLANGHDGKTSAAISFNPTRVVCANTLAMALNNQSAKILRVFHSQKVVENMELIKETINLANQQFEATAEQYKRLTRKAINQSDLKKYVNQVFYNGSQAETDREQLAREKLEQDITRLFETGRGHELQTANGTVWGLYNAVTEYLSYEKGRSQEVRLDNLWFGQGKATNQTAFAYAMKMAG